MSLEKDVLVSSNHLSIDLFSVDKSNYFHKFFYIVGKKMTGKTVLIKNLLNRIYLDYQTKKSEEPELTSNINLVLCCDNVTYQYQYNNSINEANLKKQSHKMKHINDNDDDYDFDTNSSDESDSDSNTKFDSKTDSETDFKSDFEINNSEFNSINHLNNEQELINFLHNKEDNKHFEETILVIDNCSFNSRELFTLLNIHHTLKITLIMSVQYDILPNFMRNNIDYLFITKEEMPSSIQALFDRYLYVNSYIKSFTELKSVLNAGLNKYEFIIFNQKDPQIFYWKTLDDKKNTYYNFNSKINKHYIKNKNKNNNNNNNFKSEILKEINKLYQQLDKIKILLSQNK
jgi:hypothetical protein